MTAPIDVNQPVEEAVDEAKLEELAGQLAGHMTGSMIVLGIWLGDELGLYRVMAGKGRLTADEVADAAGCNPRLVREWLDGQVAAGLVGYDPADDLYRLSPEGALALADDSSPGFVARAMQVFGSLYIDMDKITAAYRGDGGLPWGDHHQCLFSGTEWFFRSGYRAALPSWVEALQGVKPKLESGASVADVGCGHGASVVVLAEAFPNARVHGFDFHPPSIETARARAAEAGVSENTQFAVADAKGYDGTYDLICLFDCLHDMGDPVGIARHALDHLTPEGTVMLVEPFALNERTANLTDNPLAALLYMASATVCTPNSLSQEVGLGLGAQAGEVKLREVFAEAGFTGFRRAAETPLNLVLEAKR